MYSPLQAAPSMSDRKMFKLAYLTEIGGVGPSISMPEFHDVVICAGKDVSMEDIREIWPFGEDEIYFETAYYLYTKIPKSDEKLDDALDNLCSDNGTVPYDKLIEYVKHNIKDEEKREKLKKLYEDFKIKEFNHLQIVSTFEESKDNLRHANLQVYNNLKKIHSGEDWHPLSSTEDLASAIVNVESQNSEVHSPKSTLPERRIIRKSIIIQKHHELTASIAYTFTLKNAQKIHVEVSAVVTESIELRPGQYKFSLKFCQFVKEAPAPSKKENIIENDGKLSKKYRILLMNTFDSFDLDDFGIIDKEKFQIFNLLSGGGEVVDVEWDMLMAKFINRENGIPMKSFIEMHQTEADSYKDKTLPDMWVSLQELGYNQQFLFTRSCPCIITFVSTDGLTLGSPSVEYFTPSSHPYLIDYFWTHSSTIPYLKDLPIQLYKCEYFGVLVAGKTHTPMYYQLDLSHSSRHVIFDVNDLMLTVEVPANTTQILAAMVSNEDPWFVTVKKRNRSPSIA